MDLALFDFDNTITHQDMFTAFIKQTVSKRRLAVFAVVLLPLLLAYKCRVISASFTRRVVIYCGFRGAKVLDMQAAGKRFSEEMIPAAVRFKALQKINWHKERGDRVVVVSASLDLYLKYWCKAHGVDLICSELTENGQVFTGKYRLQDCCGEEKVRRVRAAFKLEKYHAVYAYGDSEEDRAMLLLADHAFLNWQPFSAA